MTRPPKRLMLTDDQRRELRREIGHAMVTVQNSNIRYGVDVLMPEIVAALVSLAAFIGHVIEVDREAFEELCMITTEFEWTKDPKEEPPSEWLH